MKTSIITVILLLISVFSNAQEIQERKTVNTGASIEWKSSTTYDFGSIKKGIQVTSTFEFTNNGNEPLIISDAKGSCGCTSVEYPQQPIAPGEVGIVKATYNALAVGAFYKTVSVSTNISNKVILLNIKGQVTE